MSAEHVIAGLAVRAAQGDDPECDLDAVLVFLAKLRVRAMSRVHVSAFAHLARLYLHKNVFTILKQNNKSLLEITALVDPEKEAWMLARIDTACATLAVRQQIRESCESAAFRFVSDPIGFGSAFLLARILAAKQCTTNQQNPDFVPMLIAAKRFRDANNLSASDYAYLVVNMYDTAVAEVERQHGHVPSLIVPGLSFKVFGLYADKSEYDDFASGMDVYIDKHCTVERSYQVDELRWNFTFR